MNFSSHWFLLKTKLSSKIALVPYLVLGLSLCLTLFFWRMYDNSLQNSAEMIYKDKTEEITSRIFKGIHENEQILRDVAGLFNASNEVSRKEWRHAIFNQMPSDIAFELYISDKEIPESLLFSSIQTLKDVLPEGYHPRYQSESKHQAFGRNWRITFKTLPAFSEAIHSTTSYAVLTSGILVSCMLTLIALLLSAHNKALSTARTYKESEERFKALSEASFGGVIIHENGLILECNVALSTISGFSYSEHIGMNGLELIAPESLDTVRTNIMSGFDQDYEVTGVRKDGLKYPLAIRGKNVVYKGHNARVIEFRDITELKRAEMIRQESEQLTHQLLESTDQGIYGIDLDGCCTFINRSAFTMLGYDATACLGSDMHDLIHHSYPDSRPYTIENCPIFRAKLTGEGFRIDTEVFWRSDGTSFQAELSSYPIFLDGAINGAVVTFSDITKRKQTESEREAALARVKKLEGIIPICMYCKKIRDDQNSWNQLEQYITNHSEAIFSHGICPHCYEEQMDLIKSAAVAKKDYVV
jgi:PAS domain S-box-containing protein